MALFRYFVVKAPKYAIKPEEINTSPVAFITCSFKFLTLKFHRSCSPPNPSINCLALFNFSSHNFTSFSNFFFFSFALDKFVFNVDNSSCTFFNSSCFTPNIAIVSSNSFSLDANFFLFGSTTLATRSYASIALIHLHKPKAATLALLILSGSNSGLFTYDFLKILIVFLGMLSLS